MKIALIGAGGISNAHMPGLAALGDVRVFSLEGAQQACDRWGITAFASLDEALAWCDVVDICTPTDTHHTLVTQALQAGKHVICEKPLCRTSDEARDVAELARQRGLVLFPAQVVRYFPAYAALHRVAESGQLGSLAVLRFARTGTFPQWSSWFGDYERSGGLIMDLMIHDMDQAVWLAGPVRDVFASQREDAVDGHRLAAAHCVLTHHSGAISYIRGVWGAPGTQFETSFHVAGNQGYVSYNSLADQVVRINGQAPSAATIAPPSSAANPYSLELQDAMRAISSGSTPTTTADDGVYAVRLAEAAITSCATGAPVRIEE